MASSTPTQKRVLSSSSTPSPSTKHPPKQVKGSTDCTDSDAIIHSIMQVIREELKTTISEHINSSVKEMAQSAADIISASIHERMCAIEFENKQLKDQVALLTSKVSQLESANCILSRQADDAEQYSRRSCLRISGLPESHGESTDSIVLTIAKDCNVDLSLNDIDRSHRVRSRKATDAHAPTRPSDIIVKFVSYRFRAAFLQCKSKLKNSSKYKGVYINEDLTRSRTEILRAARDLVRRRLIHSAWTYDGRIFIKVSIDGKRLLVSSLEDLNLDTMK